MNLQLVQNTKIVHRILFPVQFQNVLNGVHIHQNIFIEIHSPTHSQNKLPPFTLFMLNLVDLINMYSNWKHIDPNRHTQTLFEAHSYKLIPIQA